MDSNYLQNLFINEVKGALNSGGGGGNVTIPTKLSELENDLWYIKKISFLTLTKDNFEAWENPNGDIEYIYIGSPKLDWMTSAENIVVSMTFTLPDGQSNTLVSDDASCRIESQTTKDGKIAYALIDEHMPIGIFSGFDYKNRYAVLSKDEFAVVIFDPIDVVDELTIELFRVDSKKVPIEYCDTTEIKSAIDEINGEVI